jgi:hypothetical protein
MNSKEKSPKELNPELRAYYKLEDVPSYLKTTPTLREMGLKPMNTRQPAGKLVLLETKKEYKLYEVNKTKEIEKPLTKENLIIAIYTLNKAAKMRREEVKEARDLATWSREIGDYKSCRLFAHEAKTHEKGKESLYELKNKVIQKGMDDGIITFVGIHRQIRNVQGKIYDTPEDYENGNYHFEDFERETFLGCYQIGSYRFHTILSRVPENNQNEIKDLGIWLSSATSTGCIKLKDAIMILEKYLESSIKGDF